MVSIGVIKTLKSTNQWIVLNHKSLILNNSLDFCDLENINDNRWIKKPKKFDSKEDAISFFTKLHMNQDCFSVIKSEEYADFLLSKASF